MTPAARQWLKLAGIVGVYLAVLAASAAVLVFDVGHGRTWPMALKVPIALAPLIPVLFVVPWMIGNFRGMDEMQVRHQLEAMVWAGATSAFLVMGYALLEVIGFPRLPMSSVFCVMVVAWIASVWIQRWRFR